MIVCYNSNRLYRIMSRFMFDGYGYGYGSRWILTQIKLLQSIKWYVLYYANENNKKRYG